MQKSTETKPVFILSCMRSGSTLMNYLISTRDEVSNLPETPLDSSKEIILKSNSKIVVVKCPG